MFVGDNLGSYCPDFNHSKSFSSSTTFRLTIKDCFIAFKLHIVTNAGA